MEMRLRSVERDAKAIALGLPAVEAEIRHWESPKKKPRSVRQRLERLYTARKHLIDNPMAAESLVDQLKAIQNEST